MEGKDGVVEVSMEGDGCIECLMVGLNEEDKEEKGKEKDQLIKLSKSRTNFHILSIFQNHD